MPEPLNTHWAATQSIASLSISVYTERFLPVAKDLSNRRVKVHMAMTHHDTLPPNSFVAADGLSDGCNSGVRWL